MPIGSGACREQELDSSLWMFLHPHCLQTLQGSLRVQSPGLSPARNEDFSMSWRFFPSEDDSSGTERGLECDAQPLLLPPSQQDSEEWVGAPRSQWMQNREKTVLESSSLPQRATFFLSKDINSPLPLRVGG